MWYKYESAMEMYQNSFICTPRYKEYVAVVREDNQSMLTIINLNQSISRFAENEAQCFSTCLTFCWFAYCVVITGVNLYYCFSSVYDPHYLMK